MSCKKTISVSLDKKVAFQTKMDGKKTASFKTCIKIQDDGGSAFTKGFSLGFKS